MTPPDELAILKTWQPEPLVPTVNCKILKPKTVTSKPGLYIEIDGQKCLNFSTPNYLGLADDERLEEASRRGVTKYGVGSCGPRAFYGTMDVHLKLEHDLAKFLHVEEAILYSFGFTTIASAIPAYAKTNDLVFVDECCNFAIQQGILVSKAEILIFKHNDVECLKQLIKQVGSGRLKKSRSFIIVEGLYDRTGTICPLDKIIQVKREYKIRLFVDESQSFGILGNQGRGITEHLNVDIRDVDLIMVSIENALCAYGGFCAGSSYVVDHQRLAGSGYIFSASLPPFQVEAAAEMLKILDENPQLVTESREFYNETHHLLSNLAHFCIISDEISPIKHLILKKHKENGFKLIDDLNAGVKQIRFQAEDSMNNLDKLERQKKTLDLFNKDNDKLVEFCEKVLKEDKIAISVARYIVDEEMTFPLPSIKLMINRKANLTDIEKIRDIFNTKFSG